MRLNKSHGPKTQRTWWSPKRASILLVQAGLLTTSAISTPSVLADWSAFRGDGSASAAVGPATLKVEESGNLAWKTDMPGRSVASPIVFGDLVITTSSAGPDGGHLYITAVDLNSGDVRWEQSFRATGRPFCHPTSANAAPTPVSDGKRVVAFFSSNDLACLSIEGDLLWYRGLGHDHPKAGNDVGMAASPVIAENAVIVQVECKGDSFAAGIHLADGTTLWEQQRNRDSNWASPLPITRSDGSTEVVMPSGQDVVAVDPRTGDVRWKLDEGRATVSSPSLSGSYLMLPGNDLLVMRTDQSGTAPKEVWRNNRFSPRNATVASNGQALYALKGSVLIAGTMADGERKWQHRLPDFGGGWATPVVAADRIYVFDQAGNGAIIADRDDRAETVAQVELGEPVLASPALADGKLIVRSDRSLYCFQ
ncbi:outer membrane protein assembly factor BamB family protein [Crateriforma conspicua]|uniref:Outer membrane biogenesis protein BamB n=1 Tax=Crateriforma conspicua TaxID=2527996 RepID=A0A5C5Y5P6_9PLAN|nr:PQQ-binding-like beta-propeller repeat protein [Crateriforma conspicua]TWT70444.1 outer membrane biogenesis protein BamB [Crateriforma conspicua]